jgi:hypothetical protein
MMEVAFVMFVIIFKHKFYKVYILFKEYFKDHAIDFCFLFFTNKHIF